MSQTQDESTWKRWWSELAHHKGDRAQLRRCQTVLDVALTPAFHTVLKRLGSKLNEKDRDRAALVVGVLAHVEQDLSVHSFGKAMWGVGNDEPTVSDLRFRRLLRLDEPNELLRELKRAVRQVDGSAPINSLANDLMRWGDKAKKDWAFAYYENAKLQTEKS